MSVTLDTSAIAGLRAEYLKVDLETPQCQPRQSQNQIVFNLPLNDCGTMRKVIRFSIFTITF